MKIAFYTNFINHHQVPVADELYKLTNGEFYFIETIKMPDSFIKTGYPDFSSKPYLIQTWKNNESHNKAHMICETVDVVIFAASGKALEYGILRAKTGKLAFEVGERWLKQGIKNILSPRLIKNLWYYHTLFKNKPIYKLCSSAYAANDQYLMCSYIDRCFKWGYFPTVSNLNNNENDYACTDSAMLQIMWCSRFIQWKHPELPVKVAARLKDKGYRFIINMYGSGVEENNIKTLANKLHVEDVVRFCGNLPNLEILNAMNKHDIFLFTSDQNEGWGAVLNEAMSNNCVVIASNLIGAVPFLIENRENGYIFKSCDIESLEKRLIYLFENPSEIKRVANNAYKTINEIWSPCNAANNLMLLCNDLLSGGNGEVISNAPCSKAKPLKLWGRNFYK